MKRFPTLVLWRAGDDVAPYNGWQLYRESDTRIMDWLRVVKYAQTTNTTLTNTGATIISVDESRESLAQSGFDLLDKLAVEPNRKESFFREPLPSLGNFAVIF